MCQARNPLHCIVPNHILRKLAEAKEASIRAAALRALALTGRVRGRRDVLSAMALPSRGNQGLRRSIYTAKNGTQLPGNLVRSEGQGTSGDKAVDEAYDGLGDTYKLYEDVFGRDSLDGKGLPLVASVHFGQDYDNAEWDGQQMLFGDGDGVYFNRFTISVDVIGHELTHGVTQYTAGLEYHDQSGALNESFSDIFGSLVKQYANDQAANQADWLIGLGLFTDKVQGGDPKYGPALRSMLHPGTAYNDPTLGPDPQPDNMKGYVHTTDDNGGVHINSGIPNRAFALAAQAIGGNSWDAAGHIWYKTLLSLPSTAQFQDVADMTYQIAGGPDFTSIDQKAVYDAWDQVGIKVSGVRRAKMPAHKVAANPAAGWGEVLAEVKRLVDTLNKKIVIADKA
jgi:Zn-dependent metalloprotease